MRQLKRIVALVFGAAVFLVPTAAFAAPAPGYERFAGCPDKADSAQIVGCAVTDVFGGHLQMGKKDTPITDPIKLIMGYDQSAQSVVASLDGGRQRIPGGLIGLTGLDWLRFIYPLNYLQIYAEPELAGQPGGINPPISLPLKVQLHNVLLNNDCYIGANSDPIKLNLTPGTTSPPPPNQPITGSNGTITQDPNAPAALFINGTRLVDNAFAAPAARNCDLLSLNLLITALVNAQSGLPSPAGTNETVQDANLAVAPIEAVYGADGIE
jgi:hypothetical protein